MTEMKVLADAAAPTVHGRRAEVGGLLLGSRLLVGGRAVLRVDTTEPIRCEYRSGPVLLLSDSDRAGLKEQAGRLSACGSGIAGVFRSHTRDDNEEPLAVADDWRMLDCVAAGPALLVVVHAAGNGTMTGRMHVRVHGRPVEESGCLPFPFTGAPFDTEHLPSPAEAVRPRMVEAPTPAPGRVPVRANAPWRFPPSLWWPVAAGLAGAACGVAAAYVADRRPAPGNATGAASMEAEFGRSGVTLHWDGSAKGLERGATVTVNDGGQIRRFALDPSAARSGQMTFTPKSAETHVALEASGVQATVVVLR